MNGPRASLASRAAQACVLALTAVGLTGFEARSEGQPESASASRSQVEAPVVYPAVVAGKALEFPRDEGSHPQF